MYFPYFITYIIVGFVITVLVFGWALKNNQFKNQDRARFLPLESEPVPTLIAATGFKRLEAYILLLFGLAGLLVSFSAVFFILLTGGN